MQLHRRGIQFLDMPQTTAQPERIQLKKTMCGVYAHSMFSYRLHYSLQKVIMSMFDFKSFTTLTETQ